MKTTGFQQQSVPMEDQPAHMAEARGRTQHMTALQWGLGTYCVLIGLLMVVAPHQFRGPIWSVLSPQLPWVGFLVFPAGLALVGCRILGASRNWVIACHVAVAAVLFTLAYNLMPGSFWTGAFYYLILAVGCALAPFLSFDEVPQGAYSGRSFFAVLIGVANAAYGLMMLLSPVMYSSPIFDPIRPYLWLFGSGLAITGAALVFAQFDRYLPAALVRAIHLAILVPSLAYAVYIPIPQLIWSGILIWCGLVPLAASIPWTARFLRRPDPRSFSLRLAFTLALGVILPLALVIGPVTNQQESKARSDAEANMEASSVTLASHVSQYIGSYRAALDTLATYPGLLNLRPADQRAILQSYKASFPDGIAYDTVNAAGQEIMRSDDRPLSSLKGMAVFEDARRSNAPSLEIRISPNYQVPLFALASPVRDGNGRFAGVVATGITSQQVETILRQINLSPGSRVYMVDATGRAIVNPENNREASFADLSSMPEVAKMLADPADRGVVSSSVAGGDVLAAYAQVPGLGWTVLVDRPAADALAGVDSARGGAFGVLLGIVMVAMVIGSLTARRLTGPLAGLSYAATRFAGGDNAVPLPKGGSIEVQELVNNFSEMRDRLATHTAERESLLETLQSKNEDLALQSEVLEAQAEELRTTAERYRIVAENTYDWEFWVSQSGQFLYSSPACESVTGYTPEEFAADSDLINRIIHPDDRDAYLAHEVDSSPAAGELELRIMRRDGTERWIGHTCMAVYGTDGSFMGHRGTNRDITERRRAEEERERLLEEVSAKRHEAEDAVSQRDIFLSVASHELKTPLTSLLGYTQLMIKQMNREGKIDAERSDKALHIVSEQSKKIARLINQLLDVSRVQTGSLALDKQPVDLARLVTDLATSVQSGTNRHEITLSVPEVLEVVVDPVRLEQVLTNLLDNAIKFSPEGGRIDLMIAEPNSKFVQLAVRDYGLGVPPEHRAGIFDRFYQAHKSGKFGGMGLGLYVSKEIVELHGGEIAVEFPEGGGTRFVVTLPVEPDELGSLDSLGPNSFGQPPAGYMQ